MNCQRFLIVNADDFGQSPGVNAGIITAHERGIVTSASLMVRWPAAADATAYARRNPQLSVGLHIDLGEWTFDKGKWVVLYNVVPERDEAAVRRELLRQLDGFRRLLGREPSHLDSHQHVHRDEPLRSLTERLADELAIPLRHVAPNVQYRGDFYGQAARGEAYPDGIALSHLIEVIRSLPPGVTELSCHPSSKADMPSMYGKERLQELAVLCNPHLREILHEEEVQLISFAQLRTIGPHDIRSSLPGS